MQVPVSWLRDHVDLPEGLPAAELAARLTAVGLKLERLTTLGAKVAGPLVLGRVVSAEPETHSNGKTTRWCQVDVGPEHGRHGIVCGATNVDAGDLVVVALPGTSLPGGMEIAARKTYGHISDGMICSDRELGTGSDHQGILVLPSGSGVPGDDAAEALQLRDDVIEFEINPDRAYALSVRGVARDAGLALGAAFRDPASADAAASGAERADYPVVVEDAEACPVFVTRTVTGFDPTAPTPLWMARRIQLAGMRPIALAVDVTNYVMLELGQPIHGYDRDLLKGPIVVRRARPGERLRTLDDVERALDPEDLLITDDRGPIGLAGVMGGESTEIGPGTTAVVIEAAHFAAVPVARCARRHRLGSEASRRFERGVDPRLPPVAAARVADLMVRLGGGVVEPGVTTVGEPPPLPSIELAAGLPARVTGIDIDADTAVAALRAVGCEVSGSTPLTVVPPSWRPDVTDPYDLVEEVARVVGYDRVPSVLPAAPAGRGHTRPQQLRRRVGQLLAGAGCTEVVAPPFVGVADLDALGLDADDPLRGALRLENPLSSERPLLATTLAPALLEVAARNVGRGQTAWALSLLAPVFLPGTEPLPAAPIPPVDSRPTDDALVALDAALPAQPRHLAVLLAGDRHPPGWWGPATPSGWADAIAVIRTVAEGLGVVVEPRSAARPPWHPGRCAELLMGGVAIGHAGELHPRVCAGFGVPARTSYAELDLDALLAAAPEVVGAPELSTMPMAKEDVALVVDEGVAAADVAAALRTGAGVLLESLRLFDVYRGDPVPNGKKSLAFALRFRAVDRTLTEDETAAARDAAVAEATTQTGAELRR